MTSILHEAIIACTVLVTKNNNCHNIHNMKLEHKSPATKSQWKIGQFMALKEFQKSYSLSSHPKSHVFAQIFAYLPIRQGLWQVHGTPPSKCATLSTA